MTVRGVMVAVGVAALLATGGCSQAAERVVPTPAVTEAEQADERPTGIPSDLPMPEGGTLTDVIGGEVITLTYEWPEFSVQTYEDYAVALEDAGYIQQGGEGVVENGGGALSGGGSFSSGRTVVNVSVRAEGGAGWMYLVIMPA